MSRNPEWRRISLWRLCVATERKAIEWWNCPASGRMVLRSRVATYDFRRTDGGYHIRRRFELWNN